MYTSDRNIYRSLLLLIAAAMLLGSCAGAAAGGPQKVACYSIEPARGDSKADARWAAYLAGQIERRSRTADLVVPAGEGGDSCLYIEVCVDAGLDHDYELRRSDGGISLAARDDGKMLWLVYQFLSGCGDGRIDVSDLAPASISRDGAEGDFAFEYRGIYSPSNSDPELMPITATHNVDYDWALWGHNLRRVFGGDVPEAALARSADGKLRKEQLCFSSEELYRAVETFVADYGGEAPADETARFAIMPDDNKTVCLCSRCRKAGNTAASATPAVSRMLKRLAGRFPRCTFFTSSYHTTAQPPAGRMPDNVGVLVSAINLPMRTALAGSGEAEAFSRLVERWRKVVDRVYVWDYMRNFDDYLTPYPCLGAVQERLRLFRSLGVRGVFYNGSSPYYSSFDDVQTAAIAAMLVNPDLPLSSYADSCFNRYYPVTAGVLAPAYRSWEDAVARRGATLPFYGGIRDAVKTWLEPAAYAAYCDSLDRRAKRTVDAERTRLNRLLTATWFTRLELLRAGCGGQVPAARCVDGLRGYKAFEDMSDYKETNGSLDKYIKEWEKAKH